MKETVLFNSNYSIKNIGTLETHTHTGMMNIKYKRYSFQICHIYIINNAVVKFNKKF